VAWLNVARENLSCVCRDIGIPGGAETTESNDFIFVLDDNNERRLWFQRGTESAQRMLAIECVEKGGIHVATIRLTPRRDVHAREYRQVSRSGIATGQEPPLFLQRSGSAAAR
jgi:hypothetical protein